MVAPKMFIYLYRLSIALAQVEAGNTSKMLPNYLLNVISCVLKNKIIENNKKI